MKKTIALLLVCFVMVNVSFVYANEQSQEVNSVLEQIKPRIIATDAYDEFSSSVSTYNGRNQYRFNWSKSANENGRYGSLNVRVNSENVITSYDFYEETENKADKASINRMPSDEVIKIAEDMLKKLNPDISGEFKLSKLRETESLYNRDYSFNVQRYVNSLPVIGNNGTITVSSDAKTLLSFYINYTEGVFGESAEFISREKAVDSFFENFGMKLKYADNYSDGDKKIVLQYEPDFDYGAYINEYISAIDGSVVDRRNTDELYEFATADSAANMKMESAGGSSSRLTETEIKEIEKISGLLSVKDAEKLVRENKILALDNDYLLVRSSLNRDYNDKEKYIYNLRFEKEVNADKDDSYYEMANVYLDATDGKISRFYKNGKYSDEKNLTADEALKKSNEAVKTLAPEHFGENPDFILREEEDHNGNYYYTRHVNGIEYEGNSVSVGVNLADGSINSYSISFDKCEFPSADGVITVREACDKLFEQIDYSVWYLPLIDKENTKTVPVYATGANSFVIDAFSGKLMYAYEKESLAPYTDIDGHYAKDAVDTLAKFGVGFDGGLFKPDENIKQQDFVALLTSAFSYRQPIIIREKFDYSHFYSNAKNDGIVKDDEYAPESEITRMDAAVMMVRAIGSEEIAKLETIFVPVFADVNEKKGYAAILNALGVINGDEYGNFNPKLNLSRADAAIMIYNYLSR